MVFYLDLTLSVFSQALVGSSSCTAQHQQQYQPQVILRQAERGAGSTALVVQTRWEGKGKYFKPSALDEIRTGFCF